MEDTNRTIERIAWFGWRRVNWGGGGHLECYVSTQRYSVCSPASRQSSRLKLTSHKNRQTLLCPNKRTKHRANFSLVLKKKRITLSLYKTCHSHPTRLTTRTGAHLSSCIRLPSRSPGFHSAKSSRHCASAGPFERLRAHPQ